MKENITVYDVAKAANVSVSTVSRVINHPDLVKTETASLVRLAIKELGFRSPDKTHAGATSDVFPKVKKKENLLFMLCLFDIKNPFYIDLIEGAMNAANRFGHHVLVLYRHINAFNVHEILNIVKKHQVSGLILTDVIPDVLLTQLQHQIPVVQCSEHSVTYQNISFVSIDNVAASKKMVEYLISIGCRRIAFFSTPFTYQYAVDRKTGYASALSNAGLPMVPEYIVQASDFDFNTAVYCASRLFSLPTPPDAIFAVSDTFAAAVIKAAVANGFQVPKDVRVAGFDNSNISITSTPSITTVSQPTFQMGYSSCELLLNEVLDYNFLKQHIFLETELVIRESTALAHTYI